MTEKVTTLPTHETQQERWAKYGANVALVSVIVVLLAVAVTYIAEKYTKRIDTTAGRLYSLKPQTVAIIKANKQPITIINLYSKAKKGQNAADAAADSADVTPSVDEAGVVSDLIDEYRAQGSNIKTEDIDPKLNPGKVEDLINRVNEQYGGEVDQYKKFVAAIPDRYASITKLANEQLDEIKKLPLDQLQSDDAGQSVGLAVLSVQEIPRTMKTAQDEYARSLHKKIPDYKGITDTVGTTMQGLSDITAKVIDGFKSSKDDKSVPQAIRDYMVASLPKYTEIKKQADDLLADQKKLGDLKLDTLRDALQQDNSIMVLGEKEWRVVPHDKVWKTDTRDLSGSSDAAPKPRFAGEQQITTAILSLDQPAKPKVCFVRGGGPPLTEFGGRLNSVADRLRDYNFDVSEKDLSGMWAMQAMQQQQPTAPEPKDEDIADAVWIVDGLPQQQNPMMGAPPPSIAPKVAEHINKGFHYVDGKKVDGGSAFLMFFPRGDDLSAAIKPFGITARTDAMAVHKAVKVEGQEDSGDIVNSATRTPFIFTFSQWGDSVITQPLDSLEGILLQAVPIQTIPTTGVTNTALIPVPGAPAAPESWGETNLESVRSEPKFDKDTDIAPPLYAAGMAEKDGQRVVCMGSEPTFIGSTGELQENIVDFPNQELLRTKRIYAPQFPGSSDFFMNSVFWLSHQESMIKISPAAMTVSRLRSMSAPTLAFWRIGVLLIGLPGLVVLAGFGVYFARRD
jgi:hypothetical protein